MTPIATLAIETAMVNPPKPLGIGVRIDGKLIAVIELEHFKAIASRLEEMESKRETGK